MSKGIHMNKEQGLITEKHIAMHTNYFKSLNPKQRLL